MSSVLQQMSYFSAIIWR